MSGIAFGKYELGDRLASGGMAEVFRAFVRGREGFVKEVCIKRILPHFSDDAEFVEMFVAEARVAAQLHHANIVQIFDFDVVDGQYYIAMELVDGVDLRRILHRARAAGTITPVDVAVFVAAEMLKGLSYAHTRRWEGRPLGLIHRDVSPHNVLVSRSGEVKIADFGIAKAASRASATRTGVVKGKLPYMAPEQARGAAVDVRADLYATGVVLFEMLAGQRPFVADSDPELLAAILQVPAPAIRSRRPEVSEPVAAIVDRLLAKSPDDRFPAAVDALRALAVHAPPDGSMRLADHVASVLAAGPASPPREATARLVGPTPAQARRKVTGETPVPADSGASTRTRPAADAPDDPDDPDDEDALPFAATALGRSDGESGSSEGPATRSGERGGDATRAETSTGPTPAPVTRTGAVAAAAAPRDAAGARRRIIALAVASLVGVALAAGVIGISTGSDEGSLSPAAPALGPPPIASTASSPTPAGPAPVPWAATALAVSAAPATAAPRARTARPAAERGSGSIFVGADPWAMVEFRGREVGQTPRTIENVPVGTHTVHLVDPSGGRHAIRVSVQHDGDTARVFRTFPR